MTRQEREYLTDAVVGAAIGFVGTAVCWHWFLGAWVRGALVAWEMAGVVG